VRLTTAALQLRIVSAPCSNGSSAASPPAALLVGGEEGRSVHGVLLRQLGEGCELYPDLRHACDIARLPTKVIQAEITIRTAAKRPTMLVI
jgi:hypothetical protein